MVWEAQTQEIKPRLAGILQTVEVAKELVDILKAIGRFGKVRNDKVRWNCWWSHEDVRFDGGLGKSQNKINRLHMPAIDQSQDNNKPDGVPGNNRCIGS